MNPALSRRHPSTLLPALRGMIPFAIAALILLVVAPAMLSEFRLNLLAKFLTFAIIAIGLDLLWGYGGMLSLGQGVFFGLGGYAMAMYLKLVAADGDIPDFMNWSGLESMPWFWAPFRYPWFALPMAMIGPGILAFALGYFIFRSRVTGVYFSIITQAMALILSIFFVSQQAYTGGTNGLTNYTTIFGRYVAAPDTQRTLYYVTVVALGLVFLLSRQITRSRFGKLLVAIRDDENRVRFSGYNVVLIKATTFAIAGAMAGLAGALFVPQVGIISPANLGVVPSVEMVIWVAVGGRGTLTGAVIGAVVVGAAKSNLSEAFPDIWQYFLGALFIGSVLLFPAGIVGFVQMALERLRAVTRRERRPRPRPIAGGRDEPEAQVIVHGE
ncbi:MAG: urea ABC transporter permease subunit UrtC [Dehalococcoidia bacterium]